MFRVNGKIERLLGFNPVDAKWQRASLSLLPCRTFHEWGRHGVCGLGRTFRVGGQINTRTVHRASLSFTLAARFALDSQWGRAATPASCGNELSNLLAPFHRICTPMHTSRNAESFRITFVPVGPSLLASRSA